MPKNLVGPQMKSTNMAAVYDCCSGQSSDYCAFQVNKNLVLVYSLKYKY